MSTIKVKTVTLQDELKYEGVTLLKYKIEYPEFKSGYYQMCLAVVNRVNREKAMAFQKRCTEELFPMAVEQYKNDQENGYPVRVYEAMSVFTVTYAEDCILSLYTDHYEYTGGAHGNTVRDSQTWILQRCGRLSLPQMYRCPGDYKAYILDIVNAEIKKNPEIYFPDYEKLTAETFNKDSFYCTPRSMVFYYQQYDIAPYSSGIREFKIPYGGCFIDPIFLCFSVPACR